MPFDTTALLRLDALQSLGASASGASLATSTGDILEVSCYGPGVFRLRVGRARKPDYGLVVGRTKACTVAHEEGGAWTFTAGDTTLEITPTPLRFRLLLRGVPIVGSITDEHFGLDKAAVVRPRAPGTGRALALASGEPVYGLGEKFGPLNKRGQRFIRAWSMHSASTPGSPKDAPFAWSPGTGKGAWGLLVHTPASVTHGVGTTGRTARTWSRAWALASVALFAADAPAGILDLYTQLTGRPATVPLWSLGLWVSRAYYKTPEEAAAVAAKLRLHRIPCDVLTLDGRAAWKVETRVDFEWDVDRFPDPPAALAATAHHLRICVWEYPYVSVHCRSSLTRVARLPPDHEGGEPYVFDWDTRRHEPVRQC
jgi:alpha-D-xyloside xylohydrolase